MSMDSNMPYNRVNVQANNNDTIWNGAAWGAGAGLGVTGLTYGATTHGARHLDNLNQKVAGNKITRMATRNDERMAVGKSHFTPYEMRSKQESIQRRSTSVSNALGKIQGGGNALFGSKKRMVTSAATGLMGGMLAGGLTDNFN